MGFHLPRTSSHPSSAQACAACKYQRRKCAPDCILAPFFPHDRQRQFLNAHKLFGVSNITKIIKNLDPFQKEEAMRTIIFQSDVRSFDPVGGCYAIIRDLQRQIECSRAELDLVLHQLAVCKAQAAAGFGLPPQPPPQPQQFVYEGEEDVGMWGMRDSVSSSSSMLKQGSVGDFEDVKIERSGELHHHQIKFEPDDHDLIHQSEDDMLKMDSMMLKADHDSMQQAQDQELKAGVATLFTFPNCDTLA